MAASPLHHSGAWALVFDGGRAILFENRGGDRTPELHMVATLENPVPPTRMLGRDRPGASPLRRVAGRRSRAPTTMMLRKQLSCAQ
ncbi:host attachment protein [Hankyongella ginsenosidimutans]|uniref:Host attachment protein n=1 Tax=Hankyongella ginsenosidimutans TaxID=1763828 RepID=A0A4D7C3S9_9SPHN|nr:host attachment family protein [Hankyongella ginsenosidimutans]QCI80414.1 host attachment protein [Hankyongella ginsenosidimutans]